MYERNRFDRVDAFSDEPYSDRWYSKTLVSDAPWPRDRRGCCACEHRVTRSGDGWRVACASS